MNLSLFCIIFVTTISAIKSELPCEEIYEETVCQNFTFSPRLEIDSKTSKLTLKNATGVIITENLVNLKKMTDLHIVGSQITKIEPDALCCGANLTSINLVKNAKFPKITIEVLQGCQHLKKMILNGNSIQVMDGALKNLGNLQVLTINDSFILHLEANFFEGLGNLKSLTIRNSGVRTIKDGAFRYLPNLKYLDLQSNGIEIISEKAFKNLVKLRVLGLSDNKIKSLTWNEFNGLKALKVLFIERNNFDSVDVDKLVSDVPNLERIFLSWDKLTLSTLQKIDEVFPKFNITCIYTGKPIE